MIVRLRSTGYHVSAHHDPFENVSKDVFVQWSGTSKRVPTLFTTFLKKLFHHCYKKWYTFILKLFLSTAAPSHQRGKSFFGNDGPLKSLLNRVNKIVAVDIITFVDDHRKIVRWWCRGYWAILVLCLLKCLRLSTRMSFATISTR